MEKITLGSLQYWKAPDIAVPHGFTTRLGGVSTGHLASMNIGIHRGDALENVLKNYEILGNALNFDTAGLVLSSQTHSDTVTVADASCWGAGLTGPALPTCDALITATPGTTLVVFTADCTPILLWDRRTGAVGAVHAGWRGTSQNIAGKTVAAMTAAFGTHPEDLVAAIGPNIAACCFETDREVPEALCDAFGPEIYQMTGSRGDKFFPDLKKINALALSRAGVTEIDISAECTMCSPQRYWSHRVTGKRRGSQGALITCRKETL